MKIYNKLTRKESLARWCECDPLIDYTNQSEDEDEDHKEEPWFLEEEENHEQKPEENHEIESEDYEKDSNEYHEKNSNEDDDENEKNDDYSMESSENRLDCFVCIREVNKIKNMFAGNGTQVNVLHF